MNSILKDGKKVEKYMCNWKKIVIIVLFNY